jgi:imidazolonepropionase-like amidohydrolase
MHLSIACGSVVVIAVLVSAGAAEQNDRGRPMSFALAHATLIDGTGAAPKRDQTVLVTGARITAIGNSSEIQIPPSAQMLEGRGKFLIPGLWDMHVHIRGGKDLIKANEAFLTLYVANGVTGIREMGGDLVDTVLQWRRDIAEGTRLGPQIITAGPKLDGPRPQWPGSLPIATAADGRDAVAEVKRIGADFVKIYSGVPREAYFAALDEAKKRSLSVSGHVPSGMLVREVSDAGQRSIEHFNEVFPGLSRDENDIKLEAARRRNTQNPMGGLEQTARLVAGYDGETARRLVARLAANGTWVDPTLGIFHTIATMDQTDFANDPRRKYISAAMWTSWTAGVRSTARLAQQGVMFRQILSKEHELIAMIRTARVGLLAGTDTGASNPYMFPGFSLHEELALLVDAGLTPMEALQAATRNAAVFMGKLDTLGTLEKGKSADMVLLDRNPLDDIKNTRTINTVVVRGKVWSKGDLEKQLSNVEAHASNR